MEGVLVFRLNAVWEWNSNQYGILHGINMTYGRKELIVLNTSLFVSVYPNNRSRQIILYRPAYIKIRRDIYV